MQDYNGMSEKEQDMNIVDAQCKLVKLRREMEEMREQLRRLEQRIDERLNEH